MKTKTHPCFNANLIKPFRFFNVSLKLFLFESSASAAPPATIPTTVPRSLPRNTWSIAEHSEDIVPKFQFKLSLRDDEVGSYH